MTLDEWRAEAAAQRARRDQARSAYRHFIGIGDGAGARLADRLAELAERQMNVAADAIREIQEPKPAKENSSCQQR